MVKGELTGMPESKLSGLISERDKVLLLANESSLSPDLLKNLEDSSPTVTFSSDDKS